MEAFIYEALPARVIFGAGKLAQLPQEVERLDAHRVLVLSTPGRAPWAHDVARALGERAVGVFAEAATHAPVEVTAGAVEVVRDRQADCVVALGGGSTVGLGKAIADRTGLPQVAVPTTYAGSEMTPILGETANGIKTTKRSPAVLPKTVIYDVDLTLSLSLPPALTAASGLNAIAHAVVLPHAVAYNAPGAPEAMQRLARALGGVADAAQGLHALAKRVGTPTALRAIGMPEDGIDRAAELAVRNPYWNPRPVDRAAVRDLIARAWAGERPQP
jgi:maleylacetate reductase